EGSAMNIFMLRNGELVTPPVTDNILEGITRRSIIELAKNELDIPVKERSIDRTEVYICDEFFITGTAAQITAVTRVDHRPIGNGEMGPITTRFRLLFEDILLAKNQKYKHWNVEV
ncbi:MAG: aminotransferase class IV, partial [Anaerolineales bacterium]|nr:aminotransferase class IV [Anaerolineales bacterium]